MILHGVDTEMILHGVDTEMILRGVDDEMIVPCTVINPLSLHLSTSSWGVWSNLTTGNVR